MDVIFDIDGTIADCSHRLRYIQGPGRDWEAFHSNEEVLADKPILTAIALLHRLLTAGCRVCMISGRPQSSAMATEQWLSTHVGSIAFPLFLRPDGDHRPSFEVKREGLAAARARGWTPVVAFEDRGSDARMYREQGILCCQVAEGLF